MNGNVDRYRLLGDLIGVLKRHPIKMHPTVDQVVLMTAISETAKRVTKCYSPGANNHNAGLTIITLKSKYLAY
jgi:hypothetical protein